MKQPKPTSLKKTLTRNEEDWKEGIHDEIREFTINKLHTNYYRSQIDLAITKIEEHFKEIANKLPHESYVKRQVMRERQETARNIFKDMDNTKFKFGEFSHPSAKNKDILIPFKIIDEYQKIKKKHLATDEKLGGEE